MGDLPRRLGAAFLEDRLEDGSCARAYRGRVGGVGGAPVCVKIAHDSVASAPGFAAAFRSESKIALGVEHENLVRTLEATEEHGSSFVVLEWIEGVTLRELLAVLSAKREALAVSHALTVALAVARALQAVQAARDAGPRVHGDVSPQNVLLGRSGAIKLADFALARAAARTLQETTGKPTGKPGYLAPERVLGLAADARSDQFSLGIVLWEMLAGARLFSGDSQVEVLDQLVRGEVPPIHELRPDASPELGAILDVMLAVDPGRRFPTMEVAVGQLFRAHHRAVQEAGDVDLVPLLPARRDEDRTLPVALNLAALESQPDWERFSSSEQFAIRAAPGPSPDDTQPQRAALGSSVPEHTAPSRPRTISVSALPAADRVARWRRAPAGRSGGEQGSARARASGTVALVFVGATVTAGVGGYILARATPETPAPTSQRPDPTPVAAAPVAAAPVGADRARENAGSAHVDESVNAPVAADIDADAGGGEFVGARDAGTPARSPRTPSRPSAPGPDTGTAADAERARAPFSREERAEAERRVTTLVKLAQQAYLRGDGATARRALREAEKIDRNHPDVVRLRAVLQSSSDATGH